MKTSVFGNFGKRGWGIIIYTIFLFMISGIAADSMNIIFPALVQINGWDYATLMSISTPGAIVCAVVIALFGMWIQKKGPKIVTIVNLIIVCVAWAIAGFMPTLALFAIVYAMMSAFGTAAAMCSAQTYISNWFPRKKGIALGWATIGMPLSGCILVPIMNGLTNKADGTVQVLPSFLMVAGIALVMLIVTFFTHNNPEDVGCLPDNEPITELERKALAEQPDGVYTTKELLKTKQTWYLILAFSLLYMGLLGVVMMIIPRMTAVGVAQNTATAIYSGATILGIIGSIVWGLIDQRWGTKKTTVLYAILWTIMLALTGWSSCALSQWGVIATVIFFAVLFGGLPNLCTSCIIWIFGRFDFPGANKIISTIISLVRTLGILIVSWLMGTGGNLSVGLGNAYWILAACSLVGMIFVILLNRNGIKALDTSHMSDEEFIKMAAEQKQE